jgi:hypothetical protein
MDPVYCPYCSEYKGLDNQEVVVRFPEGTRDFSLYQNVEAGTMFAMWVMKVKVSRA